MGGGEALCACVVRTCDTDKGSHCVLSERVTDAVVGGTELEPASAPSESRNDDMHLAVGGGEGGSQSEVAVVMLVLVRVFDDDDEEEEEEIEVEVEVETFLMSALI